MKGDATAMIVVAMFFQWYLLFRAYHVNTSYHYLQLPQAVSIEPRMGLYLKSATAVIIIYTKQCPNMTLTVTGPGDESLSAAIRAWSMGCDIGVGTRCSGGWR